VSDFNQPAESGSTTARGTATRREGTAAGRTLNFTRATEVRDGYGLEIVINRKCRIVSLFILVDIRVLIETNMVEQLILLLNTLIRTRTSRCRRLELSVERFSLAKINS
jgi:hypothetical protein